MTTTVPFPFTHRTRGDGVRVAAWRYDPTGNFGGFPNWLIGKSLIRYPTLEVTIDDWGRVATSGRTVTLNPGQWAVVGNNDRLKVYNHDDFLANFEPLDTPGFAPPARSVVSARQERLLDVLNRSTFALHVGLAELADEDFSFLLTNDYASVYVVANGSVEGRITPQGRGLLLRLRQEAKNDPQEAKNHA